MDAQTSPMRARPAVRIAPSALSFVYGTPVYWLVSDDMVAGLSPVLAGTIAFCRFGQDGVIRLADSADTATDTDTDTYASGAIPFLQAPAGLMSIVVSADYLPLAEDLLDIYTAVEAHQRPDMCVVPASADPVQTPQISDQMLQILARHTADGLARLGSANRQIAQLRLQLEDARYTNRLAAAALQSTDSGGRVVAHHIPAGDRTVGPGGDVDVADFSCGLVALGDRISDIDLRIDCPADVGDGILDIQLIGGDTDSAASAVAPPYAHWSFAWRDLVGLDGGKLRLPVSVPVAGQGVGSGLGGDAPSQHPSSHHRPYHHRPYHHRLGDMTLVLRWQYSVETAEDRQRPIAAPHIVLADRPVDRVTASVGDLPVAQTLYRSIVLEPVFGPDIYAPLERMPLADLVLDPVIGAEAQAALEAEVGFPVVSVVGDGHVQIHPVLGDVQPEFVAASVISPAARQVILDVMTAHEAGPVADYQARIVGTDRRGDTLSSQTSLIIMPGMRGRLRLTVPDGLAGPADLILSVRPTGDSVGFGWCYWTDIRQGFAAPQADITADITATTPAVSPRAALRVEDFASLAPRMRFIGGRSAAAAFEASAGFPALMFNGDVGYMQTNLQACDVVGGMDVLGLAAGMSRMNATIATEHAHTPETMFIMLYADMVLTAGPDLAAATAQLCRAAADSVRAADIGAQVDIGTVIDIRGASPFSQAVATRLRDRAQASLCLDFDQPPECPHTVLWCSWALTDETSFGWCRWHMLSLEG